MLDIDPTRKLLPANPLPGLTTSRPASFEPASPKSTGGDPHGADKNRRYRAQVSESIKLLKGMVGKATQKSELVFGVPSRGEVASILRPKGFSPQQIDQAYPLIFDICSRRWAPSAEDFMRKLRAHQGTPEEILRDLRRHHARG